MTPSREAWRWPKFLLLLFAQVWFAHAVVFFAHEYAHSFLAWMLGWKANPLELHVPPLSPIVLLFQLGIDQDVDSARILAAGHAHDVAWISGAGVLGNAFVTLPLGLLWLAWARRRGLLVWSLCAYWIVVASVGNLLDYIPIRTFTDGLDLLLDTVAVERGLGWSPWTLLAVAGIPSLLVLVWFFVRLGPNTLRWAFAQSGIRRVIYAVVTAFLMFAFYGAAGWSEGGSIPHRMSVVSVTAVFPVVAILYGFACWRRPSGA